jgi:CHAT domain-containing protein
MNPVLERHPGDEQLAAFVDGRLPRADLITVADHLRECAECRFIVREAATIEGFDAAAPDGPGDRIRPFPIAWSWMAVAAVLAIAVIGAVTVMIRFRPSPDPIARLAAAVPRDSRWVEARLSGGFPWGRFGQPVRGSVQWRSPGQLKLDGVAGSVLQEASGRGPSAGSEHAAGVAYLLIDQRQDSLRHLRNATQRTPGEAAVWNDLGAALYATATVDDHPSDLPLALGAVERALEIDPKSVEARYNRALILEREGLRAAAGRAWRDYLLLDPGSKWAEEARAHLHAMEQQGSGASTFPKELQLAETAAEKGDSSRAREIVRTFPQESRTWGEGPLLAKWAAAIEANDADRAQRQLSVVRVIGTSLGEKGEWLLHDAVQAIDRAGPSGRAVLAEGHILYDTGRRQYSRRLLAEAEKDLRRAASLFGRAGSPMADVALVIAANTVFDQNRPDEARAMTSDLLARVDRTRYRALYAQELWEIALCEGVGGRWSAASRAAESSAAVFGSLSETTNQTLLDLIGAGALDHIAQYEEAWRIRIPAFDRLSRSRSPRLSAAIANAIRAESHRGEFSSALALSDLAIDTLRTANDPLLLADALMQRARACHALQNRACADEAIRGARSQVRRVPDLAMQKRIEADANVVDSILQKDRNPRRSIELSTAAIAFYEKVHVEVLLPAAYLSRGRSLRVIGDYPGAGSDFERALDDIDRQRSSVTDLESRSRFLDIEPDIFGELIDLYLSRDETSRAFAVSERFRARSLDEAAAGGGAALAGAAGAIRPDPHSAIVEYAWTPSGMAIFCLTANGIHSRRLTVSRSELQEQIVPFLELIRRGAPTTAVVAAGGRLYQTLLAPIEGYLKGGDAITIVADRELQQLPFAALYDPRGRCFLVERYALGLAPSARFLSRRVPSSTGQALIVGVSGSGSSRLPAVELEARSIAALYRHSTLLTGERATRQEFLRAAPRSSIIHFAGHARSGEDLEDGSLQLGRGEDASRVGTADIAGLRLSKAPVVTLAACGTLRGVTSHLEGAPSLNMAFLTAGASVVVGTLWEIEDGAAVELFRDLHDRLRSGDSVSRATQHAQLSMLRSSDSRLQQPQAWAAVEVLGDGFVNVGDRSAR